MKTREQISIQLLCKRYNIPVSFINTLQDYKLIELTVENNDFLIHTEHIKDVEKMIRLHYDLEINLEGIDAIFNLLKKVESLNEDIVELHNRLKRFELE